MFKLHFTDSKAKRVKVINEPAFAKLREKNGWAAHNTDKKKPSSLPSSKSDVLYEIFLRVSMFTSKMSFP